MLLSLLGLHQLAHTKEFLSGWSRLLSIKENELLSTDTVVGGWDERVSSYTKHMHVRPDWKGSRLGSDKRTLHTIRQHWNRVHPELAHPIMSLLKQGGVTPDEKDCRAWPQQTQLLLSLDSHLCQQGPLDFLRSPTGRCQWCRSFLSTWRRGLLEHLLRGESPLFVFKHKY